MVLSRLVVKKSGLILTGLSQWRLSHICWSTGSTIEKTVWHSGQVGQHPAIHHGEEPEREPGVKLNCKSSDRNTAYTHTHTQKHTHRVAYPSFQMTLHWVTSTFITVTCLTLTLNLTLNQSSTLKWMIYVTRTCFLSSPHSMRNTRTTAHTYTHTRILLLHTKYTVSQFCHLMTTEKLLLLSKTLRYAVKS